ncbi:unnamed protein product [Sphagnum compactum]
MGRPRSSCSDVIYPVHPLYPRPEGGPLKHDHDLTLIFFHGYSNDPAFWKTTWIQRGHPEVCWPQEWLPKSREDRGLGSRILVLSVSFDANPQGAHESVEDIGKNLVHSLVNDSRYFKADHQQRIVLVGYSFGGLVIKSLVVEAKKTTQECCKNGMDRSRRDSCKAFLRNLKGIVFYSVPHSGASKDFEKYFTDANNVPFLKSSDRSQGLTRCISDFNREMAQLTTDFLGSIEDDMNRYAILEGKAMGSKVLVPTAAGRLLTRNEFIKVEDANHMEVCQPVDEDHISYQKLLEFAGIILQKPI